MMEKFVYFMILNLFSNFSFSQNIEFEKAYKYLVNEIYKDSIYQKSGSLLPYPSEIKNNDKKNIIYINSSFRHSKINKLSFLENNSQILFDIDNSIYNSIKKINLLLLEENIIDTNYNISTDYKYNLLGWLIINNIYVRKNYNPKTFNEIFFEIIRMGGKQTKSQSLDIVHIIKLNGKWQIKKIYYIEKS